MYAAAAGLLLMPAVLVEGLGHPRYAARERCHRALCGPEPAAMLGLCRAAAAHPDAEVRRRAALLYRHHRGRCLDLMEPFPWVDMLTYRPREHSLRWRGRAWGGVVRPYLSAAGPVGAPGDRWPNYRAACRLWVSDGLDAGDRPDDWRELLAVMRDRERAYLAATK